MYYIIYYIIYPLNSIFKQGDRLNRKRYHVRMKHIESDFIVIGTGIAGLSAAKHLAQHGKVAILTKGAIHDSSTHFAQGGIAVAMQSDDTPKIHLEDTLQAGDGLCDPDHVKILVEEGPECVQNLINLGANFDKVGDAYQFAKEGAHQKRRILHARDATGREIEKTLGRSLLAEESVKIYPMTQVVQLVVKNDCCYGCIAWQEGDLTYFSAKAVLLATGGYSQIYERNSNPPTALGDGVSLAYDVGCEVMDMEFIQFHPTTLAVGDQEPISLFLISEAVRGEGALLRNSHGERFMESIHPLAELAPRDIVARAIMSEMERTKETHVYLDLSQLAVDIPNRFPSITKRCLEAKIDITREWVPVSPAAHYCIGGVKADKNGKTNKQNLYAAGEVAASGIHGANRLASNSLLEGLVFGYRAANHMAQEKPVGQASQTPSLANTKMPKSSSEVKQLKRSIKKLMWDKVGIIRQEDNLQEALRQIEHWEKETHILCFEPEWIDLKSMLKTSWLTVKMALSRKESRGAHFRKEYPKKNKAYLNHQILSKHA